MQTTDFLAEQMRQAEKSADGRERCKDEERNQHDRRRFVGMAMAVRLAASGTSSPTQNMGARARSAFERSGEGHEPCAGGVKRGHACRQRRQDIHGQMMLARKDENFIFTEESAERPESAQREGADEKRERRPSHAAP